MTSVASKSVVARLFNKVNQAASSSQFPGSRRLVGKVDNPPPASLLLLRSPPAACALRKQKVPTAPLSWNGFTLPDGQIDGAPWGGGAGTEYAEPQSA